MTKNKQLQVYTRYLFSCRELPNKEYRPQNFARKGPMSKTVTLTYPFNPFNKVTSEPVLVKSYQP